MTKINANNFSTIRQVIDHQLINRPDCTYLISSNSDENLTFKQLRNNAVRISQWLEKRGIKKGESVGYSMTNGVDTVTFILACLYGGYRLTAINLVAGNDAISYVLGHSDCRLLVANNENTRTISELIVKEGLGIPCLDYTELSEQSKKETNEVFNELMPEDDGLLMYTSGTTGKPKGVLLSQKSLISSGINTITAHEINHEDIAYCTLPLYHINAFCVSMLSTLVSGGTLVLAPKFSTGNFWSDVSKYHCTWFSLVPTQISYLLHHEKSGGFNSDMASTVRFGRSASAPLAIETKRMFEKKFGLPIIETMGLTETAAQILSNPTAKDQHKDGSPGIAYGNQIKIGDENQQEVRRKEIGEVMVKGDNVMKGYYKNLEETAKSLTKDGWLLTGDLGYMDQDGYVFITGRTKELIIKGGENIAPREIDEVLYQNKSVIEAAAFACPCENYGQTVEACVKIQDDSEVDENTLLELCQQKLGKFKSPRKIHFLPELPKGPSGKIQRLKLHEFLYGA